MRLTFQDLYYQCNHNDASHFLDEWIAMAYLIAAKLQFNLPKLWAVANRPAFRVARRPLRSPVLA